MIRVDIHVEPGRQDYARIDGDDVAEVLAAYTIVKQALAPVAKAKVEAVQTVISQGLAEQVAQRLEAKALSMKEGLNRKAAS